MHFAAHPVYEPGAAVFCFEFAPPVPHECESCWALVALRRLKSSVCAQSSSCALRPAQSVLGTPPPAPPGLCHIVTTVLAGGYPAAHLKWGWGRPRCCTAGVGAQCWCSALGCFCCGGGLGCCSQTQCSPLGVLCAVQPDSAPLCAGSSPWGETLQVRQCAPWGLCGVSSVSGAPPGPACSLRKSPSGPALLLPVGLVGG